ncbi:Uncharacterised protein [Escherichia coli]|nr:Uncharacterised protein [Escherichia coli]
MTQRGKYHDSPVQNLHDYRLHSGLTWSAPLRAQDQRYISIRNTDTIWLPGNICAYQFRLDNGGNDEGFGPLTITLQLKDKYGQTLVTRKMETEAFGDSNATRTTDAFLETECVENVATTEIIKATEESNDHRVSLPLSVFNPQDYHPTADYRFRKKR